MAKTNKNNKTAKRYKRRSKPKTKPKKYSTNVAHYFHRHIGLRGVWVDLQSSASDPYGLSISTGGTGSSTAVVGNRFVVTCGANTTTYVNIGYALQARHIPAVSEFTQLFDQYQIKGFAFMIAPGQNDFQDGNAPLPIIHSVIDYDDATPSAASEAGLNEYRERDNYRVKRFDGMNKIFRRYVKNPSLRVGAVDDSGAASFVVRAYKKYLDAAATDVPHFGIKAMLEMHNPTGSASGINFELMVKAYFCTKYVH